MSVNMVGFYTNPFRVGDKVKVNATALRAFPNAFKNYLSVRYVVVTKIDGATVFTDVDNSPTYFEHFELYEEPEETMNQQPQQKTKRVRFTQELWEKWKDKGGKVFYSPTGKQVMQLAYFPEADHRYRYVYLTTPGSAVVTGTCDPFDLIIPITTKRIPFNPELKDAKVFYGKTELIEWVRMSSDVVCGVHEQLSPFKSLETALYHPNTLEMEIEEEG